jgi:hypothetical protein
MHITDKPDVEDSVKQERAQRLGQIRTLAACFLTTFDAANSLPTLATRHQSSWLLTLPYSTLTLPARYPAPPPTCPPRPEYPPRHSWSICALPDPSPSLYPSSTLRDNLLSHSASRCRPPYALISSHSSCRNSSQVVDCGTWYDYICISFLLLETGCRMWGRWLRCRMQKRIDGGTLYSGICRSSGGLGGEW